MRSKVESLGPDGHELELERGEVTALLLVLQEWQLAEEARERWERKA